MTTPPSNPDNIREEAVNTHLAQLLRERGVPARAERRSVRGAPDVAVELPDGGLILLECKWQGDATPLERQLGDRLRDFPEAVGLVGVLYPDGIRQEADTRAALERASGLQWRLHGTRGIAAPERQVRRGRVADLADHLRALPLELEGVDRVQAAAGVIGYAVEQAARGINRHASIFRSVAEAVAKTDREKDRAAAVRIGCLALFNALAFHDRLAAASDDVPTIYGARGRGASGLRDAWLAICRDIDYVPVFESAVKILEILIARTDIMELAVEPLVKAVEETRSIEGHDLSGRLFHTLLTDAKFTGAYYTSVPAATLLARLVFHNWPPNVDWSDHEFPASLNVADLACGTGTLLMAAAAEAERRHVEAGGGDAPALHKAMVEQALHGYDVQLSAVHFAATSLAMLNPSIRFDHMNLHVLPLGVENSKVFLGSLEYLGQDEVPVQHTLGEGFGGALGVQRVSGEGLRGVEAGEIAKLPPLDLAIMNPPFTRSVSGNLLFGSLPKAERRKLQDELARRIRERQASATAGLGAPFVAAAAPKLRPGEGRLALVLPITVCTGPSWTQTRRIIEQDFSLDLVIASHDPQRWNFSDSTDLSEVLLVATRRPLNGAPATERTTFVNMWRNPAGVVDAHRMARAVAATNPAPIEGTGTALLEMDGQNVGEVLSIPESALRGGKWIGMQFARADLTRSAVRLLQDGEAWVPGEQATAAIPLCRRDALGQVGPDVRDVLDGFEPIDSVTAYPMVSGHNTTEWKRLAAKPNKHLAPLPQPRPGRRLKRVDQLWPKAGQLLIAARLRLNTARVVAMTVDQPVLSNVWWPVKTRARDWDKALAAYLSSSIGLLGLLATRNTTEGGWVKVGKADLEGMPVLDLRRLAPEQTRRLAELHDALREAEFEPLPAMADCSARRALDDGVADILSLPRLDALRRLIASEPVVSNRRL